MIKLLLLLTSIWCFCLLNGCGSGGASTTPPPPVATHFSVTSASSTPTAGTAFNITVTALDASNGEVSSYAGTVHFSSSDAQAVLPANTTLTNGTGSFTVTLKTAGSQTITATDTSTVTIKGTSNSINVFGPPATHFSVVAPANDTAGTFFTLTVNALDASNNVVTSYAGTVHFTSTDVQATLPANSTLTNGTETFSATMKTPGGQTISVTDTATASITGSSNSITVSGATASHFSVTVPATATAGTAFNFTVTALDSLGNTLAGYTGTVSFTSTDGQAALPANSTLTDGTGTFSGILKTDGNQTITATDIAAASIYWYFQIDSRPDASFRLHANGQHVERSRGPHSDAAERWKGARGGRNALGCASVLPPGDNLFPIECTRVRRSIRSEHGGVHGGWRDERRPSVSNSNIARGWESPRYGWGRST